MNNLRHSFFWASGLSAFGLLAIFLLLFARCGSGPDRLAPSDGAQAMEQLLSGADTLSAEALAAEARKLPGTWADTLFQSMFWGLQAQQNGPAIKTAMSAYEKIRPDDGAAVAFVHFGRACAYQFSARLDSADIHYKLAQDWYQQNGGKEYLISVLDCRSTNCDLRGRYDESISLKYQLLDLTQTEQDRMAIKTTIANTLTQKGDTAAVLDLLQAPLQYFGQRDTFTYTWVLTAQANAYKLKGDYAKSIEIHQKALSLRRRIGKMAHTGENLYGIANALNKLNNWQAALDTIKVAEQLLAQLNAKQGLAQFQSLAGEALFHMNRLPEADALLLPQLEEARARKRYPIAVRASLLLSKSKRQQGKTAEALDFQTQHLAFKDSVYNQEKEKIIQEAATKYETREKQAEIAALKLEKQYTAQRNGWAAVFLLSFVGGGVGFLRYRHRREKALLEKDLATRRLENEVLLANENLNRQSLENAARELELHKTQLQEFTALMLEKNTRIEALQSKIDEAEQPGESSSARRAVLDSDDVDALFQVSLVTETDWQRFQRHFEKVFPGVLGRLKIQHPTLTTAEQRLVLLTKMGLKTGEIADLLGISSESVRKLKYRFKKKTGLSEEELLEGLEI